MAVSNPLLPFRSQPRLTAVRGWRNQRKDRPLRIFQKNGQTQGEILGGKVGSVTAAFFARSTRRENAPMVPPEIWGKVAGAGFAADRGGLLTHAGQSAQLNFRFGNLSQHQGPEFGSELGVQSEM